MYSTYEDKNKTMRIILSIILLVIGNKMLHSMTLHEPGSASSSARLPSNQSYPEHSSKQIVINFHGHVIRLESVSSLQDLFHKIAQLISLSRLDNNIMNYIRCTANPSSDDILKPILDGMNIMPQLSQQVLLYNKLTPAELLGVPDFETCWCILDDT